MDKPSSDDAPIRTHTLYDLVNGRVSETLGLVFVEDTVEDTDG